MLLTTLSGCQATSDLSAPVEEGFGKKFSTTHYKKSKNYRVKRHDTLYSIAWAHNLDFRTLAQINNLHAPYKIYAGQYLKTRLSFFESLNLKKKTAHTPIKKSKPGYASNYKTSHYAFAEYEVIRPKKTLLKKSEKLKIVAASSVPYFPKKSTPVKGWRWPAEGRVILNYSDRAGGNKGIDIAGIYGSSVKAAASGKVVYSGSGLKGYGQLLLIKHNNSYLSAYAYNKRLLVKEGDKVVSGQKIAEIGKTFQGRPVLHFEIRQNGQPVNPLIYLGSSSR